MRRALNEIELKIFGQPARLSTDDPSVTGVLSACYSAFLRPIEDANATPVEIRVTRGAADSEWSVSHRDEHVTCRDLADLIYFVEKMLTIELQHRRPDLFFLHAAALSANGRSVMIIGESGAGKSTLCWDLCNAGLSYMSDELAPINLESMEVAPYPHAICLKRIAEHMPALPEETIITEATFHIPAEAIPGGVERVPSAIDMIVFLQLPDDHDAPRLTEMPRSEAAARFYSNGLNQLAHARDGLQAATKLAAAGRCFTLARGKLSDMRSEVIRGIGLT